MAFFRELCTLITIIAVFLPQKCHPQFNPTNCQNVNVQLGVDIVKMRHRWYVVEILNHMRPKQSQNIDMCVKIDISTSDENTLHLDWKEDSYTVGYDFDVKNRSVWISKGSQSQNPFVSTYEQFAGVVYVVKAAFDNAVLTFCSQNKFYSLVLVKSLPVNKTELLSIHKMFERYEPKILDTSTYCKNASPSLTFANNNSILLLLSAIVIASVVIRNNYIFIK